MVSLVFLPISKVNVVDWTLEKYFGYYGSTDAQSTSPWYNNDEYGVGASVNFSYQSSVSGNANKSILFSSQFYCSVVADETTYVSKYLSFYNDVNSIITVTP